MKLIGVIVATIAIATTFAATLQAGDAAKVAWHSDVQDAWKTTQQRGRPLLVFVTRDDCYYCTQMKDRTYSDPTVAAAISSSFVPLVIDGGENSPLLKELRVTAFPSTFVISPRAVILDRIDGYVPPQAMARRLSALRPKDAIAKVVKDP